MAPSSDDLLPGAVDPDAMTAPAAIEATASFMVFRLGALWYGVLASTVRQVVSISDSMPIPGTPVFVSGIVNVSSQLVTLIDLPLLLGSGVGGRDEGEAAPRYLVLDGGGVLAIKVDEVSGLVEVARSLVVPATTPSENHPAIETFSDTERVVTVLDVARLIAFAESKVQGTAVWNS